MSTPESAISLNNDAVKRLPRLVPRKRKPPPPQNHLPVPETPTLPAPPDPSILTYKRPTSRIVDSSDHDRFICSPTYSLLLSFVFSLSESATDKKMSSINLSFVHPCILKVLSILDDIEQTMTLCPPAHQGGSRFGNPAFRQFIDNISTLTSPWHSDIGLPSKAAISEVATYLEQSFGSRERIDYGSGHELNFVVWLLCLNRLGLLPESTFSALSLRVFPRYIRLLRKIQSTYYLEPAGSHGVWGLDDYHFLPFLFGASQLRHHPYIRPLSIHNEILVEEEGDEYIYLDMVRFTMASKTVKGLKWTQPMLDDISGAKDWKKIEQGMRRMFVKEVLGKLPVMQHFMFGSLVPAMEGMSVEDGQPMVESRNDAGNTPQVGVIGVQHIHRDDVWGDCCGIKIPSTVAASQEAKKQGESNGLRRVPFD